MLEKISLARNNLTDEAVSIDLPRFLIRANSRVVALDLSANSRLGKQMLIHLRHFIESSESEILAFSQLDLTDNHQCLKYASIMEMRAKGAFYQTEVRYTSRETPKPLKDKKAKKKQP